MKAAIMPRAGSIEFMDFSLPAIKPDEVLVNIKAAGVCTFERGYYDGSKSDFPFAGGHELSGVVAECGAEVTQDLQPGDRVMVLSLTRCGECYYCRRGYDNQCVNAKDTQKIPGINGPGGYAEQFIAKGYEVYRIGGDVPFDRATLGEPLACVIHSLEMASPKMGDNALVCGAGAMGIIHVILAKLRGVKVIVSEPNEYRRLKALDFGADHVVDPAAVNLPERVREITDGIGVENAFFTAGGRPAIDNAIDSLAIRGKLVIYGATSGKDMLSLDPKIFHYREITVTGVTKHTKDTIRSAVSLLAMKGLPLDKLITSRFPFEKIEDALKEASSVSSYRPVVLLN